MCALPEKGKNTAANGVIVKNVANLKTVPNEFYFLEDPKHRNYL